MNLAIIGNKVCCCNAELVDVYIWFWPFKGVYCINCKELRLTGGPIMEKIWVWFVYPFWFGKVRICNADIEKFREEIK